MTKQASEITMAGITLNPRSATPLYRQLYEGLRQAILDGRLRSGSRVPASRLFAEQLGVSRNTVSLAFEQLILEGYLKGEVGSGTFVSNDLPEKLLHASISARRRPVLSRTLRRPSRRAEAFTRVSSLYSKSPENIRPFQIDIPAVDAFPYNLWINLTNQAWRSVPRQSLEYGDAAGYKPLRETIATYLRLSRAARCEPEQILIAESTQQCVDLIGRVLLDPGDSVWMEDPGCVETQVVFLNAALKVTPVPIDAEGLRVDVGKKTNPHARLAYVTPSCQYPLASTMSLARRLQLLEWARLSRAWILEDDYDSEFRFVGHPLASLQGLDTDNRVFYLGTLTRILFPSLHLAYLVVPPDFVNLFAAARSAIGRASSIIDQVVLTRFIEEGYFARHIRRMRVLYRDRQEALLEAVSRELSGIVTVDPVQCGMHVVARYHSDADDREIVGNASRLGVIAHPLSGYCMGKCVSRGLLLGFAAFDSKAIQKGVRQLAQALRL
jgi:GntR family transcriptional regulator/MocR family aminotransferase